VLQDSLDALRAPTGRVIVRSPDADRAVAELDGRIVGRYGDRLLVARADPAAINAQLVAAGVRVTEIRPELRSLEELVLSLTGPGSDRLDGRGPARGSDNTARGSDNTARGSDNTARGSDNTAPGGDNTAPGRPA
jgi:ABC-2 type transport system ATP-binding protein